jgi:hypothetical protein
MPPVAKRELESGISGNIFPHNISFRRDDWVKHLQRRRGEGAKSLKIT